MASKVVFPVDVDIIKYKIAMRIYSKDAFPNAVAETLNRTAEAVTKQQIKNVKKDMIIRTKFTINSMQMRGARPWKALNKARGTNLRKMFSRAGTISKYLWKQEETGTFKGMNGPVPIPTLATRTSKNLKKSIRKTFRLGQSQSLIDGPLSFTNTKGRETGTGFIGRPKGMPRGMYLKGADGTLTMLRNLEHNEIKIKGKHFHSDAVKRFGTQQFIKAQFIKVSRRIFKIKGIQ